MAQHPGTMAMPTSEIKISLDYGNCWHTVPLATALFVDNIRFGVMTAKCLVHGKCMAPILFHQLD